MSNILKKMYAIYSNVGKLYLYPFMSYEQKMNIQLNERPVEYAFVFKWLSQLYPQRILDVGTGTSSLPHVFFNCGFKVTAIDEMNRYWGAGIKNLHYHVLRDDIKKPRLKIKFDLITCISVLEHIPEYDLAIDNMFSLLNDGGCIIMTFPYNEDRYIDDVNRLDSVRKNKIFLQQFSRNELNDWVKRNNGAIIDQEYYRVFEGPFWRSGDPVYPPEKVSSEDIHHLSCVLIKKQ